MPRRQTATAAVEPEQPSRTTTSTPPPRTLGPETPLEGFDATLMERLAEEYKAMKDLVNALGKDIDAYRKFFLSALFANTPPGTAQTVQVGSRRITLRWKRRHGEQQFKVEPLIAFLQAKGLTQALKTVYTVDPDQLNALLAAGILRPEELKPFLQPMIQELIVE